MRLIATTEKRLNELFELALGRIANSAVDQRNGDAVVLKTTIAAELDRLKAEIRDGAL